MARCPIIKNIILGWFGCYELIRETLQQYLNGRDWVLFGNYLAAAWGYSWVLILEFNVQLIALTTFIIVLLALFLNEVLQNCPAYFFYYLV